MAVYTKVTNDQLTPVLDAFGLGRLRSCDAIVEGVENSNYRLETLAGRFILTLYEKRVREEDLPFFLGLMDHLAACGIACPRPVRDRAGRAIGRIAGRPCSIVSFLDGKSISVPSAHHVGEVGVALARLHLAGADFGLRRRNGLALADWPALFAAVEARADDLEEGLADTVRDELRHLARHWPEALPEGVIHADLFTDNVLFAGDRLSGVIDFYFACVDAFAYDLAICLNAWGFAADGTYARDRGEALLRGYESVRPLAAAEVEALPLLCRGAALRFLLTRLVDWFAVPDGALVTPKDPLEYRRRLTFHRSVSDAAHYGRRASPPPPDGTLVRLDLPAS